VLFELSRLRLQPATQEIQKRRLSLPISSDNGDAISWIRDQGKVFDQQLISIAKAQISRFDDGIPMENFRMKTKAAQSSIAPGFRIVA